MLTPALHLFNLLFVHSKNTQCRKVISPEHTSHNQIYLKNKLFSVVVILQVMRPMADKPGEKGAFGWRQTQKNCEIKKINRKTKTERMGFI
jgi:hypothetical protein